MDRKYKGQDGKKISDFLQVAAWRQSAEFVSKYGNKGDRVAVHGSIQSRSYDAQDGTKRYVTEVIADNVEFLGSSQRSADPGPTPPPERSDYSGRQMGFEEIDDAECPF